MVGIIHKWNECILAIRYLSTLSDRIRAPCSLREKDDFSDKARPVGNNTPPPPARETIANSYGDDLSVLWEDPPASVHYVLYLRLQPSLKPLWRRTASRSPGEDLAKPRVKPGGRTIETTTSGTLLHPFDPSERNRSGPHQPHGRCR